MALSQKHGLYRHMTGQNRTPESAHRSAATAVSNHAEVPSGRKLTGVTAGHNSNAIHSLPTTT